MPYRKIVSKQLSDLLKALAHPHRLQIVEELGSREVDVNSLQEILGIAHSSVSQQLAVMRAHRIVVERREGRSVYYRLKNPELAVWLLGALKFVTDVPDDVDVMRDAIEKARAVWTASPSEDS